MKVFSFFYLFYLINFFRFKFVIIIIENNFFIKKLLLLLIKKNIIFNKKKIKINFIIYK